MINVSTKRRRIRALAALVALSAPLAFSCSPAEVFGPSLFNLFGLEAPLPPPEPTFLVVVHNRLSPNDPADLTLLPPATIGFTLNAFKSSGRAETIVSTSMFGLAGGEQKIYALPCDHESVWLDGVAVFETAIAAEPQVIVIGESPEILQGQDGEFRCGDVVSFQIIRRLSSDVTDTDTDTGNTGTATSSGTGGFGVAYAIAVEIARR